MRLAVLTPDVSENCLGRAHVLARLLAPTHAATIIGPQFGKGLWPPLAQGTSVPIVGIPMARSGLRQGLAGWRQVERLLAEHDAVYVSKPFATSLRTADRTGLPTLLDIDDWEPGILADYKARSGWFERVRTRGLDPFSLHHRQPWNVRRGDRAATKVAHRTVSNRFLQERYGGTLVWHARDTEAFDPARIDATAARARLGLAPEHKVVLFLGTPRRHKGLEDLADAVASLPDPAIRLVIAGADGSHRGLEMQADLRRRCPDRLVLLPEQPFSLAPEVLAVANVVSIPSRPTESSRGQMPAKVFDAMAMAKPVVATQISDLPEVLEGCGRTVPGADVPALAAALRDLLDDPATARNLGAKARERCIARYSEHALRPVMQAFVREALG